MALTRMSGPSARASPTVMALSAPLEAMYAMDEPTPMNEATDEMFTTPVTGCRRSSGTSARVICQAPITLTA